MKKDMYYKLLKIYCLSVCISFFGIATASDKQMPDKTRWDTAQLIVKKVASKTASLADDLLGNLIKTQEQIKSEVLKKKFAQQDEQNKSSFEDGVIKLTQLFKKYMAYSETLGEAQRKPEEQWKQCVVFEESIQGSVFWLKNNLPLSSTARRECLDLLGKASSIGIFYDLIKKENVHILVDNLKSLLDDTIDDTAVVGNTFAVTHSMRVIKDTLKDLKDFVDAKPTIDQQANSITENIKENEMARSIALNLLTAFSEEENRLKKKEDLYSLPDGLLKARVKYRITGLHNRPQHRAQESLYVIEHFGFVTKKELFIFNILGSGNIIKGLCACQDTFKKQEENAFQGVQNSKDEASKNRLAVLQVRNLHIKDICEAMFPAEKLNKSGESIESQGTTEASSATDKNSSKQVTIIPLVTPDTTTATTTAKTTTVATTTAVATTTPVTGIAQPTQLPATSTFMPTSPATPPATNPASTITDKPTNNPLTTKESISSAKVTPVVSASSWRSWAYTPVRLLGNAVSGAWNAVKSVFSSVRHFFRFS